jgi:hypothetical protein
MKIFKNDVEVDDLLPSFLRALIVINIIDAKESRDNNFNTFTSKCDANQVAEINSLN